MDGRTDVSRKSQVAASPPLASSPEVVVTTTRGAPDGDAGERASVVTQRRSAVVRTNLPGLEARRGAS